MNCEKFKKTTITFLRKKNIPNDLSQLIITFLECKETDCHSIDIYALGAYYLTSRHLREVDWNYIKKDKDFDDYHEDDCYCMKHMKDMMLSLDRVLCLDNEREEDSYDEYLPDNNDWRILYEDSDFYDTDYIRVNDIASSDDYSDDEELGFLEWNFNASCDI